MEDFSEIIGTCVEMCPDHEIREREKAGLIHLFERAEDQPRIDEGGRGKNVISARGRGRGRANRSERRFEQLVKADKKKAVKSYSRPAAGVDKTNPSDLRPVPVLKRTVAYLCTKILLRTDQPFIEVYDFIFDRLRAVRQDMVIQRMSDINAIVMLESIVKFHLYAEYRLRKGTAPTNYDPTINRKHLLDCLKTLLSFYGENSYRGETRPFFEALYCLSSPESYEVISRAFLVKTDMSDAIVFLDSLELCLAFQKRNFYKFFNLINELPPLLAAFCLQRVPLMRLHAFKALSLSYGVQNCKVALNWIEDLLCYPNTSTTEKDLIRIGCQIIRSEDGKDDFVKFFKTSPILKADCEVALSAEVKFTVLCGLNNTEVIATEQLCPWSLQFL